MSDYVVTNNNVIIRVADGVVINYDPENSDYLDYMGWVSNGGVPDKAVEEEPPAPSEVVDTTVNTPFPTDITKTSYQLTDRGFITRLNDGAIIPTDPDNSDYQAFLRWQAAGGVPAPVPGPAIEDVVRAKLSELYAKYIEIRESIVWVNGYGFDGDPSGQADFAQVMTTANIIHSRWVAAGSVGDEPTVPFRVWVNKDTKELRMFKLSDFQDVQLAGSATAIAAFMKFDGLRTAVGLATTVEEIEAVVWPSEGEAMS